MTRTPTRDGAYRLGLLVGDGIGPEIAPASVRVIDAALSAVGVPRIEWQELPMGLGAIRSHGTALPEGTVVALQKLDGWVLGPIDPVGYPEPFRSQLAPSGALRKHFDLYANVRPARAVGAGALVPLDLVIVRENTEGFYADRNTVAGTGEFMPSPDVAITMGIITRPRVERIAEVAFELARQRRRHLTIVHKANVLRLSMGLFRDVCREVGERYPDVTVDDVHIDAMTAHLVRRGGDFDVVVAEDLFGDILSDLTGELAGSLGIAPSLNASDTRAMAQAAHGSAPDIAGQDVANPIAMILSGGMLLDWLGTRHGDDCLVVAAARIDVAVRAVVDCGIRTRDLGGTASTSGFTDAVVTELSR
jgi:3-isopropylmalate dehydrogenase